MANFFKKKKLFIILASAVMGLSMIFAVGCNEKVEQINITKSNSPQTVYVQGNDLDFSEGKLTVVIDGERSEIPLNDPEISVSGYDKDKLGEQVLTITYKEQKTVLKVTVVPRVSVAKYESAYFVGEDFNYEKGELTITADNGESTFVNIDDPTVTVSGFDSSTANAALPITVTYQNGEENYNTTFNVAVYAVDEIKFTAPNKKAYKNHETELDVSGGYITLKGADLTRYITVTEDMVSGFDLSAATLENREDPFIQTLTVTYFGYQKTYDIQIKFSDVSLIGLRANEMKALNWTSSELPSACTEEMGENALEAMEIYFKMENTDIALLTEGDIDYIARVAAIYGLDKWQEAFAGYNDAFYLSEAGVMTWNCVDFDKTVVAYNKLLNKDPILYKDATTLGQIAEKFETLVVYGEDLVGDMLSVVYSPDTIDEFAEQLNLIISLYDALKDVPSGCTLEKLESDYADEIQNAWVLLYETKFKSTTYRSLYYMVTRWRNDYFDLLYTYYYGTDQLDKINAFKDLSLPGELESLYELLLNARNELVYMQNAYRFESTNFMLSYEAALELRDEILASEDQMLIDLYNRLEFDYLIGDGAGGYSQVSFDDLISQFRRAPYGYLQNFNVYLGIENYEELWDAFGEVINKVRASEDYMDSEEFAADAQGLLKAYLSLSPKQQFAFMTLVQPYYMPSASGRYPLYVWENDGDGYQNQFTYLIYSYYESVLPENTHEIFTELMLATEGLANLQVANTINTFFEHMENVKSLSERVIERYPNDWATFNDVVGWILLDMETLETKFAPVMAGEAAPTYEKLTAAEEEDFQNLLSATYEAYAMMMLYNAYAQQGRANIAVAFYATMEKVETYSNKILSSDNPSVLRAYYYDQFYLENVVLPDGSVVNFGGSMDFLVWLLRDTYTNALTGTSYLSVGNVMYDAYNRIDVKDFLAESTYLYFTYIYMNLLPSSEENPIYFEDVDTMMQISKDFRELTDEQRYFTLVLDSSFQMYRNAMVRFAKERNSEMASLATQLLQLEYIYIFYAQIPDGVDEDGKTYKQMVLDEYVALLSDYEELKAEIEQEKNAEHPDEKLLNALEDFNTYFGEMFEHYKALCGAIK